MKRITISFGLVIVFFIFINFSCQESEKKVKRHYSKTFDYKVLIGTTGNDKQINYNGKLIDIRFSDLSDQIAKDALLSLKWEVLKYNSDDKIKISGELLSDSTTNTNTEKIYYFILDNWTISIPFNYAVEPEGWLPGDDYLTGTKNTLDSSCFTTDLKTDYKIFERR